MLSLLEFAEQALLLPNGILLDHNDQNRMRLTIYKAIKSFYNVDKNSTQPIVVNNMELVPEYLFKAVNNRSLLKKIVSDNQILTKDDLFNYIESNLYELFHYNGKLFKEVYNLLYYTSRKGYELEKKAFNYFTRIASKKGINVTIESPTIEEDKSGIDGFFLYNGNRITIQVKPLKWIEEYKKNNLSYIAFCDGVLTNLKTDYLILVNRNDVRIFRSKNILTFPSYFVIPKDDEIV